VGIAILGPLRELDEIAYLRFASVYRSFESLADFEAEIALLRSEAELAGHPDLIDPTDIDAPDLATPTTH
jgi:transcriptional repressor NrdR